MLKKMMLAGLMTATILGGAAPAYAQRGQDSWRGRGGEQSARQDGGGSRGEEWRGTLRNSDRSDQGRAQRAPDRPRFQNRQVDSGDTWRRGQMRDDNRVGAGRNESRIGERAAERPEWRNDRRGSDRPEWRDNRDAERSGWRSGDRDGRLDSGGHWRGSLASPRRFDDRTRWSNQRRWDNGWRQDRRYDWYSYRSRYGDRYRVGRYYAPRGWDYGYSRVSVGIFLNSLLFANNYWIDDPWSYRLPPAYGTLRWIRYYDDALLVDVRDGYVVDVIRDFFW